HLALREEDVRGVELVITPGDQARCAKVAALLGPFRVLAFHREFKSVLVSGQKGKVLVVSSGIGGASLSIMVEELARLGVKMFLRVGTCGAIQEHIAVGDLIVSEGAVRMDGVSEHYAPLSYPACADFTLVQYLKNACEDLKYRYHIGITCSSATFYPGQERYDTFTGYVLRNLRGSFNEWQKLGVLNYEMEVATLFTMARVFGLRAGAVCGVLVNRLHSEQVSFEVIEEVEQKLAQVAKLTAAWILGGGSENVS
ncbi:MAG: uridine phosphorylase, partial [Atribacterota bacterium]|nr:uridine phosphorylase [Atribacterota bacterium]